MLSHKNLLNHRRVTVRVRFVVTKESSTACSVTYPYVDVCAIFDFFFETVGEKCIGEYTITVIPCNNLREFLLFSTDTLFPCWQ